MQNYIPQGHTPTRSEPAASEQKVHLQEGLLSGLLARHIEDKAGRAGAAVRTLAQELSRKRDPGRDQRQSSTPCSSFLCLPLTIPCSSLEFMGMRVMLPWPGFCSARLYTCRLWLYPCASTLRIHQLPLSYSIDSQAHHDAISETFTRQLLLSFSTGMLLQARNET